MSPQVEGFAGVAQYSVGAGPVRTPWLTNRLQITMAHSVPVNVIVIVDWL